MVNRLELIDLNGESRTIYVDSVSVITQDDGQTMKVFYSPMNSEDEEKTRAAHAQNLAEDLGSL